MSKTSKFALVFFVSLLGINLPALGADQNEVTLYLWGPDIKGSASIGPKTQPIDISFDQLIDKADAAFMGRYERCGDRWGARLISPI